MRKADYAALAAAIRAELVSARQFTSAPNPDPIALERAEARISGAERIAREFAARASVDRSAFLAACGIGSDRLAELRETIRQFDAGEPCTLDPRRIDEWRAELAALEAPTCSVCSHAHEADEQGRCLRHGKLRPVAPMRR